MEKLTRILIVDDDEKICVMFKRILENEGIDTDYVLNGRDAVEKVKKIPYDILFLDVIMPGMSGVEVLQKIRVFNKDIPVVMITGYSVSELLDQAKEFGLYRSLTKPINISQILEVIRNIMKDKV